MRPFLLALLALTLIPAGRPATAAPLLRLPWTAGQRMVVLQGQNQGTHTGPNSRYAYDFAPALSGTTPFLVKASAAGRVVEAVEAHSASAECDPAGRDNYLLIDHLDGTGAMYRHLGQNTIIPAIGTTVAQGATLARTGHTGFVCGSPHLHFTSIDMRTRQSIDLPFTDPDTLRHGGRPQTRQSYLSANGAPDSGTGSYRVLLPYIPRQAVRPGTR